MSQTNKSNNKDLILTTKTVFNLSVHQAYFRGAKKNHTFSVSMFGCLGIIVQKLFGWNPKTGGLEMDNFTWQPLGPLLKSLNF